MRNQRRLDLSGRDVVPGDEHDVVDPAQQPVVALVIPLTAVTGQAIAAFVTLRGGVEGTDELLSELRDTVAEKIGPIARPKSIVFTDDLPKTRSGKIMRRLLQDISENRQLGDVTTLANAAVVAEIADKSGSTPSD
jgi:acetyl-CoA synthetase